MKISLEITSLLDGSTSERLFGRLPLLIGRSKICDLTINDPMLSRQHCSVDLNAAGELELSDLESANGTFVNGQKINRAVISIGDVFKIGDIELRIFHLDVEDEEITVEELQNPVSEVSREPSVATKVRAVPPPPPPMPKPIVPKAPVAAPKTPRRRDVELTLKTPTILRRKGIPSYQTKDWVQVSLLWKNELADIRCFDRGDIVTIGEEKTNSFTFPLASLPPKFNFLKILPNGIELQLHPTMKGVVETRKGVVSLEDLRQRSRQTEIGLATFVQFDDRCLIEIENFAIYIQSVRLELMAPLEAPLVKEPKFAAVLSVVAVGLTALFFFLGALSPATPEKNNTPVVTLEGPDLAKKIPSPPPPPPPPPPPKKVVKEGPKPTKKIQKSSQEGVGAKAKSEEGKVGRKTGVVPKKARPIGLLTASNTPIRKAPKGAFGEEKDANKAKRGIRPDRGTGSGKPKPKGFGHQAPSRTIQKKVNVEDQGVLGALGGKGGGGRSATGGSLSGRGLGGELAGSVEGQERGDDIDSRGGGGRGAKGLGLGGGGSSLEVGGLATKGKGGGKSGFGLGSSGKKGEADVTYSSQDVEVRDGLSREEIERVVRSHEKDIQACYERALVQSGKPKLSGRLKVSWFVNRQGRVQNIHEEAGMDDGGFLFSCVSQRISTWQFPKPRGGAGAQVVWPWVFRRGG